MERISLALGVSVSWPVWETETKDGKPLDGSYVDGEQRAGDVLCSSSAASCC